MKDALHITQQSLSNLSWIISHSKHSVGAAMVVTEADIAKFDQDGAIVLRNVFSEQWVEKVREGIQVKTKQ